ncbi:GNAT family N-acetyltransferase [Flagellimonas allohymeniacidonis]|uniref:GNAT family N-acetyltransferase n=1 Tax=Flagellimonas allohymeniacidonis TaxID=2517819 RepID=A0A4Q8QN11_9FLAO|nr:GNAT family N-acetyltransferase [Allomuricauda hymeniacidonis]TAI49696.1 GNAT family N-acetyltransferase [Allomuricauda hymeniacidonis]
MSTLDFEIVKYSDSFHNQLLEVWEQSVLASHHFLDPKDFESIKKLVNTIDFNSFDVYCSVHNLALTGFIGVLDKKVEMLFISPRYFGKGIGKKLMDFAVRELKADKVDVNEQNSKAVEFYQKLGFKTFERTDKDDQGNDYPLLRMKR